MRLLRVLAVLVICVVGGRAFVGSPPLLPYKELRFYSGLLNESIPNYGMIAQQAFGEDDYGESYEITNEMGEGDGLNDALWCQTTKESTGIGTWVYPDGQMVSSDDTNPLHVVYASGQIGLQRSPMNDTNLPQGLYKCVIPNENDVNQTLVIFIGEKESFSSIAGNIVPGSLAFLYSQNQARDIDPPEFALSFTVDTLPPTFVSCQVDTVQVEVFGLFREVIITEYNELSNLMPQTSVNVILKTRMAGDYQCKVTVFRAGDTNLTLDTNPINISVTSPPIMVTAQRTQYNTVHLSWTDPATNGQLVAGYEVFYAVVGSASSESGANVSANNATLPGLALEYTYNFYVVTYSNEANSLPSNQSDNSTIVMSVPQIPGTLNASYSAEIINVSWFAPEFLPLNYKLNSSCRVMCSGSLPPQLTSYETDMHSVNYTFPEVLPTSQCNISISADYDSHDSNSLEISLLLLPQAPSGLEITKFSGTFLKLAWNDLNCTENHSAISSYVIQYVGNGVNMAPVTIMNTSTPSAELPSLTPCTNYSINVAALNIEGERGAFSDAIIVITVPELAPLKFAVMPIDNTAVLASWSPVDSPCIDHYTIYYSLDSGEGGRKKRHEEDEQMVIFPAEASSGMIEGLMERKTYLFSIAVTYSIDGKWHEGERTDVVSLTTGSEENSTVSIVISVVVICVVTLLGIVIAVILSIWYYNKRSRDKEQGSSKELGRKEDEHNHEIVLIGEMPTIAELPSSIKVEEGSKVVFKPRISGDPNPSYQWYHENQFSQQERPYEISANGSLIIETVDIKHSGTYTILVTNFVGMAEHQISLNVISKDEFEAINDTFLKPAIQGIVTSNPVPIHEFQAFVANNHANSNAGFHHTFVSLDSGEEGHDVSVGNLVCNVHFNRFNNITPYDDNRVILEPIDDLHGHRTGYINASYIHGYNKKRKFIATQGPMKNTVEDFWYMVWQEQSPTIIMVTELMEANRHKCKQYWPDDGTENYGFFDVTLINQKVYPAYVTRTLEVELAVKPSDPLRVTQFHYKEWVDHTVPKYSSSLVKMHHAVRASHGQREQPIIIHCSAGVGRTGTYITIDTILDGMEQEGVVDVCGIIVKMRLQRMKMVQTMAQFIFIHDAILEAITCGNTEIEAAKFKKSVDELSSIAGEDGKTGIWHQFDVLNKVSPLPESVHRAFAAESYLDDSDLPDFNSSDRSNSPQRKTSASYAHPTFISDYDNTRAFIIAKSPLEGTRRNFWKMIMDRECRVIVMLCQAIEGEEDVCAQYWPDKGSVEFGEYIVTLEQSSVQNEHYMQQELTVTDSLMDSDNSLSVVHFQMVNWDSNGHCSSPQAIIAMQQEMYKIQCKTGNKPVVVHCSDTISRSGMFCAIATVIEQCKTEGAIDVFQVVKFLRAQSPGAVPALSHYQFIFDTVVTFLDDFDDYSNWAI